MKGERKSIISRRQFSLPGHHSEEICDPGGTVRLIKVNCAIKKNKKNISFFNGLTSKQNNQGMQFYFIMI